MDLTPDQQREAFNHLGSTLLKNAWGSVDPVTWITATYSTMYRPDLCSTAFVTVFTIEPRWRVTHGYRQWIEASQAVAQAYIPDKEKWLARDIQTYFHGVVRRIEDSIEAIGEVLYEHDPRIGFLFDRPDVALPECPLFTRRGPPWKPKWDDYDYPPPVKQSGCPLCASEFDLAETPMWAGSNLGWVHAACWGEGMQREPSTTTMLRAR